MTIVSQWIPSAHHSSRNGHPIDLVVLHFTGGNGDEMALGRFFGMPSRRAASHYGVGRTGRVAQYVSESRAAWHAGDGKAPRDLSDTSSTPLDNVNRRSIGIEICNRGFAPSRKGRARADGRHRNPRSKSTSWEAFTAQQIAAVVTLLGEIHMRHPGIIVTGHEDVTNYVTAGGSKTDPGPAWPWWVVRDAGMRRMYFDFDSNTFRTGDPT